MVQRKIVHPRYLVIFSFSVVAAAMWHYSTFTLGTDYRSYALARAFQGLGYGFFFVSANIIAYSQLRPDQNNRSLQPHQLLPQLGRQLRHRTHHDQGRAPAAISPDKFRRGDFRNVPAARRAHACAGRLPDQQRIHGPGCSARRTKQRLSATGTPSEPAGFHGLFPDPGVGHSGNRSVAVRYPPLQTRRKVSSGALGASDSRTSNGVPALPAEVGTQEIPDIVMTRGGSIRHSGSVSSVREFSPWRRRNFRSRASTRKDGGL